MSTVTIRPEFGVRLGDLTRLLVELADGDATQVRSGGGGMVVSHDLAATYFATRGSAASAPEPAAALVPPNLGRVVTQAEDRGGLTRRRDPAKTTNARARTRATTAGLPARTEEHTTHG